MDCVERKDQILLYAAGMLEGDEAVELRSHLAGGCPQCAGNLAEAEATLAMLPLALPPQQAPPELRDRILRRLTIPIKARAMKWDRVVVPSAIAAVLAVAVTLLVVRQFWPAPAPVQSSDHQAMANLEVQLVASQTELANLKNSLGQLKFAQLTGPAQPDAIGRVFLDLQNAKWYFFASGMKPAAADKTYELWLICADQKIPAGTFNVGEHGTATLLGAVPSLPAGATVTLAVTDEPAGGSPSPTGNLQIKGTVE